MQAGIYAIVRDDIHQIVYIGSSSQLDIRLKSHRKKLQNGTHENRKLLALAEQIGYEHLEIIILEYLDDSNMLLEREAAYIAIHQPICNIAPVNPTPWNRPTSSKPAPIPKEENIQKQTTFLIAGSKVTAIYAVNGIYLSLLDLCVLFQLDLTGQVSKIKRAPDMMDGLKLVKLHSKRGVRDITCLHIRKVALWIAGIDSDRIPIPEIAEQVFHYQLILEALTIDAFHTMFDIHIIQFE